MTAEKPGRPLGLSIAIIASTMLFSLLPLAQALFYLSFKIRFQNIEFLEGGGAVGGSIEGISDLHLALQFVIGIGFLVLAFFAWRGKPAFMRLLFVGAVLVLAAATIISTLLSFRSPVTVEQLFDPVAALSDTLVRARLIFTLLITLYVVWYVNRGPARAFYRGYYLNEPEEGEHR